MPEAGWTPPSQAEGAVAAQFIVASPLSYDVAHDLALVHPVHCDAQAYHALMNTHTHTQIILIGGASGVGKSTVAHAITQRLGFAHHISTGYLREALRAYLTPAAYPDLFHPTFRPPPQRDLLAAFEAQAAIVCAAATACIARAEAEGTDTIVEGNHLLPALLHHLRPTRFVLLHVPPEEQARRLFGATHRQRAISATEVARVIQTQTYLVAQAHTYSVPVIINTHLETTVSAILGEAAQPLLASS